MNGRMGIAKRLRHIFLFPIETFYLLPFAHKFFVSLKSIRYSTVAEPKKNEDNFIPPLRCHSVILTSREPKQPVNLSTSHYFALLDLPFPLYCHSSFPPLLTCLLPLAKERRNTGRRGRRQKNLKKRSFAKPRHFSSLSVPRGKRTDVFEAEKFGYEDEAGEKSHEGKKGK